MKFAYSTVTPHAGVWIETARFLLMLLMLWLVTPHAGVWIETLGAKRDARKVEPSRPTRACGLKP